MSSFIRAPDRLRQDLALVGGGALVGFDWGALPDAMDRIDWALRTATNGYNVLRHIPPAQWPAIFNGTSS